MKHRLTVITRAAAAFLLALASTVAFSANSFTVTNNSGPAPLTVHVVWNIDNALNCTGSGLWSGTKLGSGVEDVVASAAGNIVLSCNTLTPNGPGQAVISWVAATQNTDGSAYTNPGGYWLYRGGSATTLTKFLKFATPATLSYTDSTLQPGQTTFYAITSLNDAGLESAWSATGSKTIPAATAGTFTDTKAVTIVDPPKPKPPTGVSVQ